MAEPVLELEGVTKSYGETVITPVLHGIHLRVDTGEFAALIGPSGSGKSTLLNLIGLLDRPTGGRIVLAGEDTSQLDDTRRSVARGRTLGFVFQFHHLLPAFTAVENVMMPLMAQRGRQEPWMRERALGLLEEVGMASRAHHLTNALSGGQQQRVAIARALAPRPRLVLADEPTGNLDTRTADEVFALLRRFNVEHGTTFLIVTHDARLAGRCDRIISVVDGRIASDLPHVPSPPAPTPG
ncbi:MULTISPECIES: ABC transporter ATP-binding protein [Corallococcus]|uniref:ABC transporter ATP-binding protein n=1 Tax=Corallococcus exercitus TaxID=2316736 RepID=A0A7Y4JZZ9_9BACT|nr:MULTISPECIES: ABC transporter ATP-binding protein [Corallococcus]MBZ4373758.1 ABC transporter ATP-binding protein [Corallococcus sp. AS-1-6]NOK14130.1 ABC transporter ATP-binding protein [Corallococcus exercitus]